MKKISIITLFMLLVLMPAAAYRVVQHAQSNFAKNSEPVAETPAPAAPTAVAAKSSAKTEKVKGSALQMTNYGKGAGISVGRGGSAAGSGGSAESSAGASRAGSMGNIAGIAGAANAANEEMDKQKKKCQENLDCKYCTDSKQKNRCDVCRALLSFSSNSGKKCNWDLNSNDALVEEKPTSASVAVAVATAAAQVSGGGGCNCGSSTSSKPASASVAVAVAAAAAQVSGGGGGCSCK